MPKKLKEKTERDKPNWSSDHLEAHNEAARLQANYISRKAQLKKKREEKREAKAIEREEKRAYWAAMQSAQQTKLDEANAELDRLNAERTEAEAVRAKALEAQSSNELSRPSEAAEIPEEQKSEALKKAEKAVRKATEAEEKERQKLIADFQKKLPPSLTDEDRELLKLVARPTPVTKSEPDRDVVPESQRQAERALEDRLKERKQADQDEGARSVRKRRVLTVAPLIASLKAEIKGELPPEMEDDPEDTDTVLVNFAKSWPSMEKLLDSMDSNLRRAINTPSAERDLRYAANDLQLEIAGFAPTADLRVAWIDQLDRIRNQL